MTDTMLDSKLILPEALMAFLHNKDGQVYQSVQPRQLTAAAELGELALTGHVEFDDDKVTAAKPAEAGDPAWTAEVIDSLSDKAVKIDSWLRKRNDSVKVQQEAALEQGVLSKDRAKLAGLIGYDRHMVDETAKEALLAELDAPDAVEFPRTKALAKLVTTPAMLRVVGLDDDRVERLKVLAESDEGTPLPGPVFTAMDYGLATAVAITVFGD